MQTVMFKFSIGQYVLIKGSGKKVEVNQQNIDDRKIKSYCCKYFDHEEGLPNHHWIDEKNLEELKKPKPVKVKKPVKKKAAAKKKKSTKRGQGISIW